jgi:hypothetical protein
MCRSHVLYALCFGIATTAACGVAAVVYHGTGSSSSSSAGGGGGGGAAAPVPQTASAPEINAGGLAATAALVLGGVALITARRGTRSAGEEV